ncbi:MmpS family transport accessory protein [Carbonactinospora thermoautotrophica]|uniref:MmpS family transport accessory protein n=1 Tax=Carbonactinospora thermoautotrophica TaxID=1469144 RepID=UPI002270668E|nr:MmpS family transport accessory protein [Carbonactinospora thermoautotrophica]
MRKLHLIGLAALPALVLGCSSTTTDGGTTKGPGVSASKAGDGSQAGTKKKDDGARKIVFEVTGSGVSKATSITYTVGGNSSQANNTKLPWEKEASSTDPFLLLSLVAQSGSGGDGSISCRIKVDGKVIVENTSQGAYAVVTCSGSA